MDPFSGKAAWRYAAEGFEDLPAKPQLLLRRLDAPAALRIREIDMRASPYDLRDFGREPILLETEDGRREYRGWQARFADEARPLRGRLIKIVATLAGAASES